MLQGDFCFRDNTAGKHYVALHTINKSFTPFNLLVTCGEDDILGDEIVIHDGKLRQFDLVHPCHSIVSPPPVELDVVCSVAI